MLFGTHMEIDLAAKKLFPPIETKDWLQGRKSS